MHYATVSIGKGLTGVFQTLVPVWTLIYVPFVWYSISNAACSRCLPLLVYQSIGGSGVMQAEEEARLKAEEDARLAKIAAKKAKIAAAKAAKNR